MPLPAVRSVADTRAFAGEAGASQLLSPLQCVRLGVQPEQLMTMPRDALELRRLLDAAGIAMTEDDFSETLALACSTKQAGSPHSSQGDDALREAMPCTLHEFLVARRHLLERQSNLA